MSLMKKLFGDYSSRELKSIYPIVDKIDALADEYKAMSDAQLKACLLYTSNITRFGLPHQGIRILGISIPVEIGFLCSYSHFLCGHLV